MEAKPSFEKLVFTSQKFSCLLKVKHLQSHFKSTESFWALFFFDEFREDLIKCISSFEIRSTFSESQTSLFLLNCKAWKKFCHINCGFNIETNNDPSIWLKETDPLLRKSLRIWSHILGIDNKKKLVHSMDHYYIKWRRIE